MRNPKLLLSLLCGILLSVIFPRFSLWFLGWLALIPLYLVLAQCERPMQAAKYAFIAGAVFFSLSLHWLIHVIFFGWIIVALFQASFWLILGWAGYYVFKSRFFPVRVLGFALAWMMIELFRSDIPVLSLGWNLLGYSQASQAALIQSAGVWGVFGLGFVMAAVNGCLAEALRAFIFEKKMPGAARRAGAALITAVLIFAGLWSYGSRQLKTQPAEPVETLRIALIQGNIPQSVKWELMARDQILEIYFKLTELASYESPELIVWPEAAFPGYFNRDADGRLVEDWVAQIGIPALIGAPHYESYTSVFNSAYLVDKTGLVSGRYDKINLVPFGEYVPFGRLLDLLKPLAETLGVSDFSAGRELTSFQLRDNLRFSVLICFEDTFPKLVRNFAKQNIRFLAVITNDAWFGHTGAPYQHLQASIFRAAENGLPVVRAANTGVSAFIDARGRLLDTVRGRNGGEIFETGRMTRALPLEKIDTLYGRGGWLFPYAAAVFFVMIWLPCMIFAKDRRTVV